MKIDYTFLNLADSCFWPCPVGYYVGASGITCDRCNTSCAECNVSATNCTACNNSRYLYGNACVTLCPPHTFNTTVPAVCVDCSSNCETCSGSMTSCDSCPTEQALALDSTCVASCPSGTFQTPAPQTCLPCTNPCQTCDGSASSCLTCVSNYPLYNGVCLTNGSCPPMSSNTIALGQVICYMCDPSCLTCSGPGPSACLNCNVSLHFYNNSC